MLTEQGELLLESAKAIASKIAATSSLLSESKEEPSGQLRVTANQGFGSFWLTSHLKEFLDLYPDITIHLLVLDAELDLSMREADVAIRLTAPSKPDLIQKKLRTAHTHLYASPGYLESAPPLETIDDLDRHRLIDYGTDTPPPVPSLNWDPAGGPRRGRSETPREPALSIIMSMACCARPRRGRVWHPCPTTSDRSRIGSFGFYHNLKVRGSTSTSSIQRK